MPTRALLTAVERFRPAQTLLRRRYERRFRTPKGAGALCGVYPSFHAAAAAAPADAAVGYDHAESGTLYRERLDRIVAKDYPALFWLREVLPGASTVFDLGGHVGVSYYAFRRYLDYPPSLRWTVCEVPAVANAGVRIARERGATALGFTSDPHDATGCDVLLTSGALQYIEQPLHALVAELSERPRHIVVNQMPTHPEREFFTVQHIGVAYCPYRIAAADAVPDTMAAHGYELVDRWDDPSRRTAIPHEAGAAPISYTGYYLRLR